MKRPRAEAAKQTARGQHPKKTKGPLQMPSKGTSPGVPGHEPDRVPRLSPAQRSLQARMAAHVMHSRHDARRTSSNGRATFLARFEAEVDPDGALDPEERARRAEHARSAYFARLSLSAAKSR